MIFRINMSFIILMIISLHICIFSQTITKENIENAEKVIGLEFSDAERDSMQSTLDSQLSNYENIRKIRSFI